MTHFRKRTAAIALVCLALGVAGGALLLRGEPQAGAQPSNRGPGASGPRGERAPAVTLVPVEQSIRGQTLTAVGTSRANQSLTVTTEVSGVVHELHIDPGKEVAAGAPLVVLDKREQEIALARARSEHGIAKTNAARWAGLYEEDAASALENEEAQNVLAAATAALRQAEYELTRRTVRAPFAGVVGLTTLDIGDYVAEGTAVTTVDDVSSIIVDFVVPESAAAFLTVGQEIRARTSVMPGETIVGRVRALDSRIDPQTRTLRVEAVVENPDRALLPGGTFSVEVAMREKPSFVVPGLAVQWDRAGSFVWRADAERKAERVPVVIVERTPDTVLVDAPLKEGDLIVAEGADLVRPGAPLAPASAVGEAGGAFR